jgi:hypothetical protein
MGRRFGLESKYGFDSHLRYYFDNQRVVAFFGVFGLSPMAFTDSQLRSPLARQLVWFRGLAFHSDNLTQFSSELSR